MERDDRAPVATFFVDGPLAAGRPSTLERGRRRITRACKRSGRRRRRATHRRRGASRARATIADRAASATRSSAIDVRDERRRASRRFIFALRSPIATACSGSRRRRRSSASRAGRRVRFRRSASVSPRGEGDAFSAKVRARMVSRARAVGRRVAAAHSSRRRLGFGGARIRNSCRDGPERRTVDVATRARFDRRSHIDGRAGGRNRGRRARAARDGRMAASEARAATLRFETAAVAAIGVIRAAQESPEG